MRGARPRGDTRAVPLRSERDHVKLAEPTRKPSSKASEITRYLAYLDPPQARRAQHNPGVRLLPANRLLGQQDEMAHISGDEASPLSGSVPKLLAVRQLAVPDLQGTHGVDPRSPESFGNLGGNVLIQADLQTDCTRPGDQS